MRFLGAKVVLTPAAEKGSGMVAKAMELAQTHNWFLCRQFENEANPDFHSKTTAVEILEDFAGEPARLLGHRDGDGRHAQGVARVLKKERPENEDHRLRAGQLSAPGQRHCAGASCRRHGIGKPSLLSTAPHAGLDAGLHSEARRGCGQGRLIDEVLPIKGGDALRCSRELAQKAGIFTGINRRRHIRRRAADLRARREGREGPVHAAGHRRTLSQHAAVRGRSAR